MATGELSVARRYAAALFGAASKRNEVDAVAANLQEVVSTVLASRELQSVLHHPRLPREKKTAVLRGIFSGSVRPDVEKFLFLVVEKDRAILLPQIQQEFNRLVDEHRGEADGEAVSAVPLSAQQISALNAALNQRFGVKVRLKTRVDENVLGGLVVRVGDKLIDGSAATRLEKIKEQLKRTKVA
jgi:F-type H+-transporting ATPase subunit delta